MWLLPAPVATPPMPRPDVPDLCPAPTETQGALSVGAGVIFSKADSMRDNDPCVAIKYSALLWDRCQYRDADRILNVGMRLFAKKAGVDWEVVARTDLTNDSVKDCAARRAPAVVAPVHYETIYVPPPAAAPASAPVAACAVPPSKPKSGKPRAAVATCNRLKT
jgi:hypothetical protein